MPAISLVVCVHLQRDLLERLISKSQGCYDELIVEHDIPDMQNVREAVETANGKFFERPPTPCQEPHWPFMWRQAKHDWILRLDADEFPSDEMKVWLREFGRAPEPPPEVSGYTCIWPLWDGKRAVTKRWPAGRLFLFNKQRVRFFGIGEQSPMPDGICPPLDLILCHQPYRKSYGLRNQLTRHPRGRLFIVHSLLGKPTGLNCWRWESQEWPLAWEQIRQKPLWTALKRTIKGIIFSLRDQWRAEGKVFPLITLSNPMHFFLISLEFRRLRRSQSTRR